MSKTSAIGAKQDDIAFQAKLYSDPNPTRRGLHGGRRDWIEARLARHMTPTTRAIEIGVGCGIFTRSLAARAASVTAIDINQKFLDGVADLAGVEVRNVDATTRIGEGEYDVALCSEVLEHVPPDRSVAMLRAMAGALKPGGLLILTTPQRFATVELVARLFKFPVVLALARKLYGSAEELGHVNLLTAGALRAQIAEAGLAIEESDRLGFYLPVVAEVGGGAGWALLKGLGNVVKRVPVLRGLIWTQAYVLRRAR